MTASRSLNAGSLIRLITDVVMEVLISRKTQGSAGLPEYRVYICRRQQEGKIKEGILCKWRNRGCIKKMDIFLFIGID